jgi:hypothetical protein
MNGQASNLIENTFKSTGGLLVLNSILILIFGMTSYICLTDESLRSGYYLEYIPCLLLVYLLAFTLIPLIFYIKSKRSGDPNDQTMAYNLLLWSNLPIYVAFFILIVICVIVAHRYRFPLIH